MMKDYDPGFDTSDDLARTPKRRKESKACAGLPATPVSLGREQDEADLESLKRFSEHDFRASPSQDVGSEPRFTMKSEVSHTYAAKILGASSCDKLADFNARCEALLIAAPPSAKLVQTVLNEGLPNLSETLAIPRIAVIGEQSHGKSSLFEALTGLDWPRGQGKTTSFPTAFTKLKKHTRSCFATIVARGKFGLSVEAEIERFTNRWQDCDVGRLGEIIQDAAAIILAQPDSTAGFSDWQLSIEYGDPGNCAIPITFIDTPGIVAHSTASGSAELIKQIAKDVIGNENTLVLHVVQGSVDLDTVVSRQLILQNISSPERLITVISKIDQDPAPWVFDALRDDRLAKHTHGRRTFLFRGKSSTENKNSVSEDIVEARRRELLHGEFSNHENVFGVERITEAALKYCLRQCVDLVRDLRIYCIDREDDVRMELEQIPHGKTLHIGNEPISVLRNRLEVLTQTMQKASKGDLRRNVELLKSHKADLACSYAVRMLRSSFLSFIDQAFRADAGLAICRGVFEDSLPQRFQEITDYVKSELRPSTKKTLQEDDLTEQLIEAILTFHAKMSSHLTHVAQEKVLGNAEYVKRLVPREDSGDLNMIKRQRLENELDIVRRCKAHIEFYDQTCSG